MRVRIIFSGKGVTSSTMSSLVAELISSFESNWCLLVGTTSGHACDGRRQSNNCSGSVSETSLFWMPSTELHHYQHYFQWVMISPSLFLLLCMSYATIVSTQLPHSPLHFYANSKLLLISAAQKSPAIAVHRPRQPGIWRGGVSGACRSCGRETATVRRHQ